MSNRHKSRDELCQEQLSVGAVTEMEILYFTLVLLNKVNWGILASKAATERYEVQNTGIQKRRELREVPTWLPDTAHWQSGNDRSTGRKSWLYWQSSRDSSYAAVSGWALSAS